MAATHVSATAKGIIASMTSTFVAVVSAHATGNARPEPLSSSVPTSVLRQPSAAAAARSPCMVRVSRRSEKRLATAKQPPRQQAQTALAAGRLACRSTG